MRVFLLIIGIIIIIMSAVLMLAQPIIGAIGVLFGIFIVYCGKKDKPKTKTEDKQEETAAEETNMHKFSVAGFDHYQKELKSLLNEPSYEYSLTGKSFKEEVIGRAYQYETELCDAELVDEPDNEFDANAIAVYVDGMRIGYIAKKDQAAVKALDIVKCYAEIYGGKYKEVEVDWYEDDGKILKGETPYRAMLYIESR